MNMTTAPDKDPLATLVEDMEAELDQKLADEEKRGLPKAAPFTFTPHMAPKAAIMPERPRPAAPAPAAAQPAPSAPIAASPAAESMSIAQRAGSEAESFLANGARLLDKQRRKILEMESQNEFARVKLIDDYRVKLRDLEHEASEALREFDEQFDKDLGDAKRILDALAKMRG